jgi:transcriptional regulator with XRE-family HTH domain
MQIYKYKGECRCMKNISKKIKELRIKRSLTLEELGEKINFNYSNLSKIERGLRPPTLELIEKLSEFYNVPLVHFFGEEKAIPDELKKFNPEWVAFIEDMEEKDFTPDEITEIVKLVTKFSGKGTD